MKNLKVFSFAALLFVLFAINGVSQVYGWGSASGDGTNYRQLQETAIFFNNTGNTVAEGDVVILDLSGSGNTQIVTGTTLGSYVTQTSGTYPNRALADNILAVGVVKSTSVVNQRPVVVVTKGPALTTCDDSADAVSTGTAVGTSGSTTRRCGGGTNLGVALEPGDGTDGDQIIIWVDPTGAD